jgi:pyruvate dehydrogenase E1 component alpha subunit
LFSEAFDGKVDYLQVMDEKGNVDQQFFPKDVDDNTVIAMYKNMMFTRAFDNKVLSLQRQGRTSTFAPSFGEEATHIGSAMAMRKDDIFVPAFRQTGVYYARKMPMDLYLLYWIGYEDSNKIPKEVNGFPMAVPVATQLPHSVGIAFAQKYQGRDAAVVVYVGDGGTSEGDFSEALNFAGVWKTPLVIIIENNQWAISMPREKQSAAKTLAQKAFAAGINCIQVDGNDVMAVYKATKDAIENSKNGPTVIECVTYRMGMHTTSDDPTKYRTDEETEKWKLKDPILRVKMYLTAKGIWNDDLEKKTIEEQSKELDDIVQKAEAFKPDPEGMFNTVYSFVPEVLKKEFDEAKASNYWQ